ncbi:MAG: hypothetical protein HoeaKO_14500 [Hoeflea alexandrii]
MSWNLRSTPRAVSEGQPGRSDRGRLRRAIKVLDIDHINVGAYIRNTLAADKNTTRQEQALFDIYRVMRPGEPPTTDSAEAMFNSCSSIPSATTFRPLAGSR